MNRKNIYVDFPLDNRPDNLRNELLDGQNHEIVIEEVKTFFVGNLQFYIVNGFDFTKNCGTGIVLLSDNGTLKKVPLVDYSELKQFEMSAKMLNDNEIHDLLDKFGYNIQSLPMTTIEKLVKEREIKKNITVYTDPDVRRFISTKDAVSLGYDNPRDVLYLPTEKVTGTVGYKLITEEEYENLKREYIISDERVGKLDVIYYNDNYYVDWLAVQSGDNSRTGFQFYGLDNPIFNEEPLSKLQFERIKKYYSVNLLTEKDLNRNSEVLHPESASDEEPRRISK